MTQGTSFRTPTPGRIFTKSEGLSELDVERCHQKYPNGQIEIGSGCDSQWGRHFCERAADYNQDVPSSFCIRSLIGSVPVINFNHTQENLQSTLRGLDEKLV